MILTKKGIIVEDASAINEILNEAVVVDKLNGNYSINIYTVQHSVGHGDRIKSKYHNSGRKSGHTVIALMPASNSINYAASHTGKGIKSNEINDEIISTVNAIVGLCGYLKSDIKGLLNLPQDNLTDAAKKYSKLSKEEQKVC